MTFYCITALIWPLGLGSVYFFIQATLKVYKQLKDEYFGLVRQAGELDLQLKEMKVAENLFVFFVLNSPVCCDVNCML